MATFGAATSEHVAAALGGDACQKAMFALTFDFAWLIDAFDGKEVDASVIGDAVDVDDSRERRDGVRNSGEWKHRRRNGRRRWKNSVLLRMEKER